MREERAASDCRRRALIRAGVDGVLQWRRLQKRDDTFTVIHIVPCGACNQPEFFTKDSIKIGQSEQESEEILDGLEAEDDAAACHQVWAAWSGLN